MKAESSGISLNDEDAAVAKGMIARGDRQHDIAAWFGVNGGRIGEIATGQTFAHVQATTQKLPPPGPYLTGKASLGAKKMLEEVRGTLSDALKRLDDELAKLK
jgi:hypothetical protein